MKIAIVVYEPHDKETTLIIELRHQLSAAGHDVTVAPKSLSELKHNPKRIVAMLESLQAQAHIIEAGSTEVLKQAALLPQSLFALFGRLGGLKIPVVGKEAFATYRTAVKRLHECGHKRIVMLSRLESFFLEELKERDLPHGAYNVPEWDNTADGLNQCLNRLFQLTPPDAIIISDSILFTGVQNYLLRKRGQAARNVVCISMDYHPSLAWCKPGVAHFRWDPNSIVQRIVGWAGNVAKGKEDKRQVFVKAKFIENGALELD
jgi:DNA-binding LacI/PurR family transcriptional regulator